MERKHEFKWKKERDERRMMVWFHFIKIINSLWDSGVYEVCFPLA